MIRDRVVPAANDNLSGCVASLELAKRLVGTLPDDIELVVVITGCEEAGAGGATKLARAFVGSGRWSTGNTTVLALDTFSGGEPRLLQEGELIAQPLPPRLVALADQLCAEDASLGPVAMKSVKSFAAAIRPDLHARGARRSATQHTPGRRRRCTARRPAGARHRRRRAGRRAPSSRAPDRREDDRERARRRRGR